MDDSFSINNAILVRKRLVSEMTKLAERIADLSRDAKSQAAMDELNRLNSEYQKLDDIINLRGEG